MFYMFEVPALDMDFSKANSCYSTEILQQKYNN